MAFVSVCMWCLSTCAYHWSPLFINEILKGMFLKTLFWGSYFYFLIAMFHSATKLSYRLSGFFVVRLPKNSMCEGRLSPYQNVIGKKDVKAIVEVF